MASGNEELISEYIDRTGVASDTEFMLAELNKLYKSFQNINGLKISLAGVSGMSETVKLTEQLNRETTKATEASTKLTEAAKQQVAANIKVNATYKELLDQTVKNEIAQKELAAEKKRVTEAFKLGILTEKEYIDQLAQIKEAQTAISVSTLDLNRGLRNFEKEIQANEGSLEQMRAQLNLLIRDFDKLSAEEKQAAQGQELVKKIQSLTKTIQEQEQATGRFQRNVGNYQGSAKIIVDAFDKAQRKVTETTEAFGQQSPEAMAARREFEALERITSNPQFLNISAKVGDTNKELRFFAQRLNELEDAGLKNSDVYKQVQTRLAQLTDQIGDTRAEIKAMSSDTRQFDLFAGAVNTAADIFQTAAGAAALFGDNEERVAEITKNLIAVQSVANGVKGIANELTTKGTAANKAFAFVQGLVTTAMDKTAAASARLNAALGLLGLAATVIGAIVVAFAAFRKETEEVVEKQNNLNDVMKDSGKEYVNAKAKVNELSASIQLAKKGFVDKSDVVKEYNDSIGKTTGEVKNLDEAEQALAKNAEAYIRFTFLKAAANVALQKAAEKAFEAEVLRQQNPVEPEVRFKIDIDTDPAKKKAENLKRIATSVNQFSANALTQQGEDLNKIADNFFQQAGELAKKFKFDFFGKDDKKDADASKKLAEERRKQLEQDLKAEFDILKSQQQRKIDFDKSIVEDEKAPLEQRLIALSDYNKKRADLINAEAELEKSIGQKSAKELELVEEKRYDATIKLAQETASLIKQIYTKTNVQQQIIVKGFTDGILEQLDEVKKKNDAIAKAQLDADKEYARQKRELYKELYDDIANTLQAFLSIGLEKEKNAIQEQIDALEEKKQKEIEVVNQTITNEAEKADQIAVIEARATAQREQLERRQKELDIQRAKIEKAAGLIRIAVDTATKVFQIKAQAALLAANPLTLPYVPVALAQIPFVIAGGVLAAAAVAATPIPKYKHGKGKGDNYEGPALLGDGYKHEPILRESGAVEISPDEPTVMHVGKNDMVFSDIDKFLNYIVKDSTRKASEIRIAVPDNRNEYREMTNELKTQNKLLAKIANKPDTAIHADRNAMIMLQKWGANQLQYLNDQTNWNS